MSKDEAVSFSPREMEVLALAWQCFESEPKVRNRGGWNGGPSSLRLFTQSLADYAPQIDIKKLARLTGYTEGSASVTIGKIKRKLKVHATGAADSDASVNSPATPKRAVTRARVTGKRTANAMDPSPAKKVKSTPGMTPDVNLSPDDEEEYKIKIEQDTYPSFGKGSYGGYGPY